MKNFFSCFCFCLLFAASVFSQTSTDPAGSSDAPAVDTPQPGTVPDASAGTPDSVIPQAESPETVPQLPSGERLLYFYPEPDFLYLPPISPVTATPKAAAKPAAPASAPAGNQSAVQSPVAPTASAASAAPAASTKPAGSTADKAAEKTSAKKNSDTKSTDAKKVDAKSADAKSADKEKTAEPLPGIWTAEPVAPATQVPAKAAAPVPSRKASLALGQTLEVWYPGSGWVYLGDVSAQNGLNYESRKLDKSDTLFTFRSVRAGDYILEFSRYDVLSDSYSSDLIAVTVADDGTRKAGKIRAPDYRSATLDVAALSQASASPASTLSEEPALVSSLQSAVPQPAVAVQPTAAAQLVQPQTNGQSAASSEGAALLAKAKASLSSGDAVAAISALDVFFGVAVDSLDEGWFLRGQAYEANSAARDIRKALGAYQTLVSAFPESSRWNEADARIRYIKQYYLGR